VPPAETLEERFRRLAAIWEAETWFYSDPDKITGHPAFQEIIRMGEAVIPLLLRDLQRDPHRWCQWVWALPDITGADPVPLEEAGYLLKMSETWVRWGQENG
jgi:hypothetical protein